MVLQFLDLAAGLEDPEVLFDAPAQGVPAQDARGVVGAGHTQRGQHEPLQRLDRGRRLFLARMDDKQLDRLGPGARQRHRLVAQGHLGDAGRTAVLASLFAGLHPRAQPPHLDRGGAAGRPVAHLVEQTARDRVPVGRLLPPQHAVDLRPDQQFDLRGVRPAFDEQVEEVGLAVHRAHHPGLTQLLGRRRAVAQPLDPAERLPFLPRLRLALLLGFRGLGRVERRPQDSVWATAVKASAAVAPFRSRYARSRRPSPCPPSGRRASSSSATRARRSAGRARGSPRSRGTP